MSRKKKALPLLEKVTITDVAAEGKALAKVNDMVVFVPYVVPGDVVDLHTERWASFSLLVAELPAIAVFARVLSDAAMPVANSKSLFEAFRLSKSCVVVKGTFLPLPASICNRVCNWHNTA